MHTRARKSRASAVYGAITTVLHTRAREAQRHAHMPHHRAQNTRKPYSEPPKAADATRHHHVRRSMDDVQHTRGVTSMPFCSGWERGAAHQTLHLAGRDSAARPTLAGTHSSSSSFGAPALGR